MRRSVQTSVVDVVSVLGKDLYAGVSISTTVTGIAQGGSLNFTVTRSDGSVAGGDGISIQAYDQSNGEILFENSGIIDPYGHAKFAFTGAYPSSDTYDVNYIITESGMQVARGTVSLSGANILNGTYSSILIPETTTGTANSLTVLATTNGTPQEDASLDVSITWGSTPDQYYIQGTTDATGKAVFVIPSDTLTALQSASPIVLEINATNGTASGLTAQPITYAELVSGLEVEVTLS